MKFIKKKKKNIKMKNYFKYFNKFKINDFNII